MATEDNKTKPLNRDKPFSRVASPVFDSSRAAVSGRGFAAGCRALQDFPSGVDFLVNNIVTNGQKIVRAVPNWVGVPEAGEGLGNLAGELAQRPMEVQGVLVRSFQTWTDFPAYQWHRWFDWNFHLEPDIGYRFVRGRGNDHDPDETAESPSGLRPVSTDRSMECEWDCGGIGTRPGPLFNSHEMSPAKRAQIEVGESERNWSWPMTGQYIWLAGRWIYDCGHSNPPDDKQKGRMRTELHPCKCMASARWGAFNFEENGGTFTPAIEFVFFAHRVGAYKSWSTLADQDYEFIVDLPPLESQPLVWDIGSTPENPLNTGVLREPHLLTHFDFTLFDSAATLDNHGVPFARRNAVKPVIEPIKVDGQPVTQVRVKIPLTSLPPTTDIYGVRIWLGWLDPDQSQARKVREVVVKLDRVVVGDQTHDTADENPLVHLLLGNLPFIGTPVRVINLDAEWQLRIAVNNHWLQTPVIEDVQTGSILTDGIRGKTFSLHLAEGDELKISAHGAEYDPVGDFMREKSMLERTLFVSTGVSEAKAEAVWDTHIVNSANETEVLRQTLKSMISLMSSTLGMENGALGLIEPGTPNNSALTPPGDLGHNPLVIGADLFEDKPLTVSAFRVSEVGELAELVADPNTVDYTLHYTVSVRQQAGLT